jgi:hypothetical protein
MSAGNDTPTGPAARRARKKHAGRARRAPGELRGKLRPHDPFELIRWLALSQPDPRKALSELVQNSLDAGASTIRITRRRERRNPCLFIWDDGEGVIPDMPRAEALKYIATHIGHSRKRSLSPRQRLELMTQGQYGIGLLGFWSLGQTLEMRTAVPGQRPHRLVLHRDQADYRIEPLRGRLPLDERWTEVVVVGLHREAQTALIGRRAADYLAAELRGQLLSRAVEVIVEDRMSRGRAQKVIPVRPPRFLGDRLEGIGPVEVPGYPPIRFEIYLSGERSEGEAAAGLAVYATGTLVAQSFNELGALGLDRDPWTDLRLTGFVDFPAFRVAPGSRRGVVVDEAAGAFARALGGVEPILAGVLEAIERRRAEEIDRGLIRDLQRAFRDFYRQRPSYSMLPVRPEPGVGDAAQGGAGAQQGPDGECGACAPGVEVEEAAAERTAAKSVPIDLLPPGPLHEVKLTPSPLRVECLGSRTARAQALDAAGRAVNDEVSYRWTLSDEIGSLTIDPLHPDRVKFDARDHEANARLRVVARSVGREAAAEIDVEVLAELPRGPGGEGIPEPELVNHPGAVWRSRMLDGSWQVNAGHREFRAVAERPALKLRYLAMLFAKEVVLRSHQDPRLGKPLEQLVEIAGYADRKLAVRGRKRKSRP